jgi:hypothetical protein
MRNFLNYLTSVVSYNFRGSWVHTEDGTTRFETGKRKQKFNIRLENCIFRWFMLYNYITMQGRKHKKGYVLDLSQPHFSFWLSDLYVSKRALTPEI